MVISLKTLTIFAWRSILDFWLVSEYASDRVSFGKFILNKRISNPLNPENIEIQNFFSNLLNDL